MKHDPVTDACDAGEFRVLYVRTEIQHADLSTKPLDIQVAHKHAKTVLSIVLYESNSGICLGVTDSATILCKN